MAASFNAPGKVPEVKDKLIISLRLITSHDGHKFTWLLNREELESLTRPLGHSNLAMALHQWYPGEFSSKQKLKPTCGLLGALEPIKFGRVPMLLWETLCPHPVRKWHH